MANVSSSNGLEKRPKLRFPGFDEPWKMVSLQDISEYRKNKICVSKLKYISTENMLQNFAGIIPYTSEEDISGVEFCVGDTLLANIRPYLRKAWLATHDGACSTDVLALCPLDITPAFLNNIIEQDRFIDYVMSGVKGSKMPRGDKAHILAYETAIPSLLEQEKINSFMQLLHQRIAKIQMQIELLKKYKRGVNNQILSQIDNSYNCRLGSVCEIVGGGTPDTLHTEYWGNTVEWFTPSEIGKTKYVNNSVRKLSDIGLDNSSAKLLPIGTVLLTTRATLGEMSIAKRECSTNQGFQSLIPHTDRVSSEYLYYMQIIIKPWCEKYASGNTFREISKSALSDCIIPIPDRARQEQIVKLLSSIDMLIGAAESISMSLSKIRHGLMQQLFI